VLECQDGDATALRVLFDRWQPRFMRLAWRLTADREAARDVVQDAWLAIVRGLRRLDDPARFRVWACRIISNKCADWVRRRVVERRVGLHSGLTVENATDCAGTGDSGSAPANVAGPASDPAHVSMAAEAAEAADDLARMRAALATLPYDRRAVLAMHYLDGLAVADIARVLGVPAGTVKSRLYHAREQLRRTLERTWP
jgi:RNA polymerase sigma-70 factor (ECF subfamily)